MCVVSIDEVVTKVAEVFDGICLAELSATGRGHSNQQFSMLDFENPTARLRLLFYRIEELSFLAVVDLRFQPYAGSERSLSFRVQDEELESLLADSGVMVVTDVERNGYVHAYARQTQLLLDD